MTSYTHDAKDTSSLGGDGINFSDVDRQGTFWVASGGTSTPSISKRVESRNTFRLRWQPVQLS